MSETRAAGLDVFYPIVPDATWVARIVPLGVRTLQLRVKDAGRRRAPPDRREPCRRPRPRLPAHRQRLLARGDRRRRRLRAPRPGGSAAADMAAIKAAGMRLGISTHSEEELDNGARRRARLRRAGPDLRDKAQSHEMGAARAGAHRRLESADRRAAACRHRRHHAGARRRCRRGRAPNPSPSSPIL